MILAFSIDWSALLTTDNLIPLIFGILVVVLPQYKEQIEKLKALFGKGETTAMKLERAEYDAKKLAQENERLVMRMRDVQQTAAMMQAPPAPSDPRADANVAVLTLTDHFVAEGNPEGIEAVKAVWSHVNKVQPPKTA